MTPDPILQYCPTLRGSHVTLEPLIADHATALFALLADDELWRYTDDNRPTTLEALYHRYLRLESRRSPDGSELWLNWAVAVPHRGIVGFVQATVAESLETAAIAYVIARRFWSRGFGTAAVHELVRFLRRTVRVKQLTATVDARNSASLQILSKLGFGVIDATDHRNVLLALPMND